MIKLTYNNAVPDLDTDSDGLTDDDTFETAVLISLLSWARADADVDDVRDPDNLGGWWGDSFADEPGDEIGSKLWLLFGAKVTTEVLSLAEQYTTEALQWAIDDGIASGIDAAARRVGEDILDVDIFIERPDLASDLWLGTWEAQLTQG